MLKNGSRQIIKNNYAGDFFEVGIRVVVTHVGDTDYIAQNKKGNSWWVCDYSFLSDEDI